MNGPPEPRRTGGLPFDEEAKLVYGVVLSLRNMVKKLAGRYVPLAADADQTVRNS